MVDYIWSFERTITDIDVTVHSNHGWKIYWLRYEMFNCLILACYCMTIQQCYSKEFTCHQYNYTTTWYTLEYLLITTTTCKCRNMCLRVCVCVVCVCVCACVRACERTCVFTSMCVYDDVRKHHLLTPHIMKLGSVSAKLRILSMNFSEPTEHTTQ